MPRVLTELEIDTIGFVDKGANPAPIVFAKRHGGASNKGATMPSQAFDSAIAALSEEQKVPIMAYVAELQAQAQANKPTATPDVNSGMPQPLVPGVAPVAAPAATAAPVPVVVVSEPKPGGTGKADDDKPGEKKDDDDDEQEVAKAIAKLPARVRKRLAEGDALATRVAALEDEKLTNAYVAKARREMPYLPGLGHEQAGRMLKSMAATMPTEQYAAVEKSFRACSEAIEKSNMFRENGAVGGDSADAMGKLNAIAKAYCEKDGSLTREQAFCKAADAHPELVREQRRDAREVAKRRVG